MPKVLGDNIEQKHEVKGELKFLQSQMSKVQGNEFFSQMDV